MIWALPIVVIRSIANIVPGGYVHAGHFFFFRRPHCPQSRRKISLLGRTTARYAEQISRSRQDAQYHRRFAIQVSDILVARRLLRLG